jgi:hypothetical protein
VGRRHCGGCCRVDGLTSQTHTPVWWGGRPIDESPQQPDVAYLREGDGASKGRTWLYQQNWFGPLIRIRMLEDTEVGDEP